MSHLETIEGARWAADLVRTSSADLKTSNGRARLIGRLDGAKLHKPPDYAKGIDRLILAIEEYKGHGFEDSF